MTYYAATLDAPPAFMRQDPQGFSAAATSVARELRNALEHYRSPRLKQIGLEITNLLQAEIDAEMSAVDDATVRAALSFVALLPRTLPAPEIAADPDGEVSFDWLGPAGKMFSVSVSKDGRIAYAGRFGEKSKIHGIEQLSESLPAEIIRGIQKTLR